MSNEEDKGEEDPQKEPQSYDPEELAKRIQEPTAEPPQGWQNSENKSEAEEIALGARRQVIELRRDWSKEVISIVKILLVFQICLVMLIGSGQADFTHYKEFLLAVTVQVFLQILGLGYIIVKALFHDDRAADPAARAKPNLPKPHGK